MSDFDDAMNDYDWYQNTGENREYFEDNVPNYHRYGQQGYHSSDSDGVVGCIGIGALCLLVLLIIGLLVWLI